jgi:hypothetical protein
LGERDEQQLSLVGADLHQAELIQDEQVEVVELRLQSGEPVLGLGLGELDHQVGHGDEADPPALGAGLPGAR